jgi:hypothetical protein
MKPFRRSPGVDLIESGASSHIPGPVPLEAFENCLELTVLSAIFLVDLAILRTPRNVMARLGSMQMQMQTTFESALKGLSQLCPAASESVTLRHRRIQWAWWVLNT